MTKLPRPPGGRADVVEWVRRHLGHLACDEVRPSSFPGGQRAADAALAALDVTGYAWRRNEVLPVERRGATRLSPYIRHGLLSLPAVWDAVEGAPAKDRQKFRDELSWQEYARHLYARVGRATARPLRFAPPERIEPWDDEPWPQAMACMAATSAELREDGWLVNQTRMWLSSQYAVRAGADWRRGEREMYRHLIDGSAAANRLGWQWTVGTGTGKVYGFSRWQVEKRAPGLCASCTLAHHCPIQKWPAAQAGPAVEPPPGLVNGETESGPTSAVVTGTPDAVWLTAESLGEGDPARVAHPDLPAIFVFDEPLLAELQLSAKRLVFLTETLSEMGAEVHLGDPVEELAGLALATTYNYVPGWKRRRRRLDVVALHPWPWLRQPGRGSLRSYSAWRGAWHRE